MDPLANCGKHCTEINDKFVHCKCFSCHGAEHRATVRNKNPMRQACQLTTQNVDEFVSWLHNYLPNTIDIYYRSKPEPQPIVVIWEGGERGTRERTMARVHIGYWVICDRDGFFAIADNEHFRREYEVEKE